MNKVFLGIILGAAAATVFYKMNEQGKFDGIYEDVNDLIDRTKQKAKRAADYTRDEAEYLAEKARKKAEYYESIAKKKAGEVARKVESLSGDLADRLEAPQTPKEAKC